MIGGLGAEEQVVVEGANKVRAGDPVRAVPAGTPAPGPAQGAPNPGAKAGGHV